MLTKAIQLAIFALVCVAIVVGCYVALYVETLTQVTAELPIVVDRAIAREGAATRRAAERQIEAIRKDLFQRVDRLERDANDQLDLIRQDANTQLDAIRTAVMAELAKITDPAGETIEKAKAMLAPAQRVVEHVATTSDLLLDCDHNPNCIANRTIGTMKAVEKTARSVEKMADTVAQETPETAAALRSTSKDLSTITARFARPTTWIKTALGTAASVIGKFLF